MGRKSADTDIVGAPELANNIGQALSLVVDTLV